MKKETQTIKHIVHNHHYLKMHYRQSKIKGMHLKLINILVSYPHNTCHVMRITIYPSCEYEG
jgi:hypothetical protein